LLGNLLNIFSRGNLRFPSGPNNCVFVTVGRFG
jgi:hypothetical protein